MNTLLSQVGLYTYESYLTEFNKWAHEGQTSSKDTSSALVEFTKLNWTRTQRLQKTISLSPMNASVWNNTGKFFTGETKRIGS